MKAYPFLLLLLLAGCASSPAGDDSPAPEDSPRGTLSIKHTPEEAESFIRRFEALRVGLINYFNPVNVELINREFTGTTIVFRLDKTGDSGAFHMAAVDQAAELAVKLGWDRTTSAPQEHTAETHLALVQMRSIGIPAGSRAGDTIPVILEIKGNASDIRGGYVYRTPLRNQLGRTVAELPEGYLPFRIDHLPEEDVTDEMRAESALMEKRDSASGSWFLLRSTVKLARDVHADDLTADQIILPLERAVEGREPVSTLSAELIPNVIADIERQMAEIDLPVSVKHEPGKLIITPTGIREATLHQIYERLEGMRVEVKPRNRVLILFDDTLYRVAIYGPVSHRFLLGDVALTTDPFTRNRPGAKPYQLPFRVSLRVLERAEPGRSRKYGIPDASDLERGVMPDGHKGRVRISWSRWRDGRIVAQDSEDLDTADISEVLRHLWTRGMDPRGVLAFVDEAVGGFAINAELGYNQLKIDLDALAAEE